jgi:quinol-cytochrome oxidoreductase complex cytochrome b subunit
MSGSLILGLTYVAGVTGAIMPCSTLGEVTATIVGSALASLVYVKFDFLETIIVPGLALTEEAIFRTFLFHVFAPFLGLLVGFIHMTTLHLHKYSAGGGFERLPALPRLREARR